MYVLGQIGAFSYEPIPAYDVPSVQVVMASSPTHYGPQPGGGLPAHDPVFANNLNPDATQVRPPSRFHGPGQVAPGWEALGLRRPFPYDPSQVGDFVIEVRVCGRTLMTFPVRTASVFGAPGQVGGNLYWSQQGCNVLAMTTTPPNESSAYIRIDYHDATAVYADFFMQGYDAGVPVVFDDRSGTPDPGGIVAWQWDFGDGGMATVENPTHVYACQGTYTVTLTVTDAANQTAVMQRTLVLGPERLVLATTGGGVGDLVVTPPRASCFPTAVRGHTLVSLATFPGVTGIGPLFGLVPDTWTFFFLAQPPRVGNPFHFVVAPGAYPDIPLHVPAGYFSPLAGTALDAVIVYFDAQGLLLHASNVGQAVF